MQIGVAVITYNRIESLKRCIATLLETAEYGVDYSHLVIVSDHSTDGTSDWLSTLDNVVKVEHETNQGYVSSFNGAMKRLIGFDSDILFIVNDDHFFRIFHTWISHHFSIQTRKTKRQYFSHF